MKPIARSALAFALATLTIVAAAPGCAVEEGDDEEAVESTVEQPLTMAQLIASADWFSGCTGQAQLRKQGASPRAMSGWFFNSEAGISLNAGSSTAGTIFLNPAGIQLSAPFTLTQSGNALTFKFSRTPSGLDSKGKPTSHGFPMQLDECLKTQGLTWRATQVCGGPNDKRCADGKVCDRGANNGLGACLDCGNNAMCQGDAHFGKEFVCHEKSCVKRDEAKRRCESACKIISERRDDVHSCRNSPGATLRCTQPAHFPCNNTHTHYTIQEFQWDTSRDACKKANLAKALACGSGLSNQDNDGPCDPAVYPYTQKAPGSPGVPGCETLLESNRRSSGTYYEGTTKPMTKACTY